MKPSKGLFTLQYDGESSVRHHTVLYNRCCSKRHAQTAQEENSI